jgi:hypothetical protein
MRVAAAPWPGSTSRSRRACGAAPITGAARAVRDGMQRDAAGVAEPSDHAGTTVLPVNRAPAFPAPRQGAFGFNVT